MSTDCYYELRSLSRGRCHQVGETLGHGEGFKVGIDLALVSGDQHLGFSAPLVSLDVTVEQLGTLHTVKIRQTGYQEA